MSKRESFEELDKWWKKVDDSCDASVVAMLVGNKCDLPNRAVTYDEGMNYAKSHGLGYMEISAKTGQNVENTFQMTVTNIHKNLHGEKDKPEEV